MVPPTIDHAAPFNVNAVRAYIDPATNQLTIKRPDSSKTDLEMPNLGFAQPDYVVYKSDTIQYGRNLITGSIVSNSSFSSLMSMLETNLTSGGTIFLNSGVFDIDAPLTVGHSINILGAGRRKTILRRIMTKSSTTLNVTGSNLTISGITFDGNYPTNNTNLYTELSTSGQNVLITDVEVKNFANQAITNGGQAIISNCALGPSTNTGSATTGAIYCAGGANVKTIIDTCTIANNAGGAVLWAGHTTVRNCYIGNNVKTFGGGQIAGTTPGIISIIEGNIIDPPANPAVSGSGIEIGGNPAGNYIIRGNRINGQTGYGIVVDPLAVLGSAIITKNVVNGGLFSGIVLLGASGQVGQEYFTISDNTSCDNATYGIQLGNATHNHYIIKNNMLFGNGAAPILDQGTGTDKIVRDNTVSTTI